MGKVPYRDMIKQQFFCAVWCAVIFIICVAGPEAVLTRRSPSPSAAASIASISNSGCHGKFEQHQSVTLQIGLIPRQFSRSFACPVDFGQLQLLPTTGASGKCQHGAAGLCAHWWTRNIGKETGRSHSGATRVSVVG